ncbi:DUF294 nucleotidyltransferase-like domain-containing protein [Gorillibacterium timonense]|uniref:DUF294 nucleotidyltransferase-like domain-containing protein n=1 Tax=Gorillibacterium timonense TaxID=1689269 RepID=UPI00071CFBC4|nr:DUF294 nucleotidyltransferase-like domain-containing protein [Gorillibacterium timonense]
MTTLSLKSAEFYVNRLESMEELLAFRKQMTDMLRDHPLGSFPQEYNDTVNGLQDKIMQKAISIAERSLIEEGHGPPPVPYAFILFGSGGRREQTLWSDQDNGLIYADPTPDMAHRTKDYFMKLGDRIVSSLADTGYPPCEGGVTCNHSRWNKPAAAWIEMLQGWELDGSWEAVRYLLIVADLRHLYGEKELAKRILAEFAAYPQHSPTAMKRMLENTLRRKPALGVFGQLITERYGENAGHFDVKYGLYIPFASGIRLLAIHEGVWATSTSRRLEGLRQKGSLSPELLLEWQRNFSSALYFRTIATQEPEPGKEASTPMLDIGELDELRKLELKRALRSVRKLQRIVAKRINGD